MKEDTEMTFRKPSRMSRSLRLSSNAFSLTKGMLLELDLESLAVLTACAASTVRSRAARNGSACCSHDESIVADRSRSRKIPLISTPSLRNTKSEETTDKQCDWQNCFESKGSKCSEE
jgi:hypothetical protein